MSLPVPELQSAILDSAHDPIIVIDGEGMIQEFNPAAEQTFGTARADCVGREMATLDHSRRASATRTAVGWRA